MSMEIQQQWKLMSKSNLVSILCCCKTMPLCVPGLRKVYLNSICRLNTLGLVKIRLDRTWIVCRLVQISFSSVMLHQLCITRDILSLCAISSLQLSNRKQCTQNIEKGKNSWMKKLINGRVMKVKKLTYIKISNSRDFSFKLLNHEGSFNKQVNNNPLFALFFSFYFSILTSTH